MGAIIVSVGRIVATPLVLALVLVLVLLVLLTVLGIFAARPAKRAAQVQGDARVLKHKHEVPFIGKRPVRRPLCRQLFSC
jgi:hypothetical protein